MSGMENPDLRSRREDLVARMLEAGTEDEAEAAEEAAGRWLAEHPGDLAVAAAGERLAARRELLEDSEARGWRGLGGFFSVCVVPLTVVVGVFSAAGTWRGGSGPSWP